MARPPPAADAGSGAGSAHLTSLPSASRDFRTDTLAQATILRILETGFKKTGDAPGKQMTCASFHIPGATCSSGVVGTRQARLASTRTCRPSQANAHRVLTLALPCVAGGLIVSKPALNMANEYIRLFTLEA